MLRRTFLLSAASLLVTTKAMSAIPNRTLNNFALLGQSNMVGRGFLDELPPSDDQTFPIWNYRIDGTWQRASNPLFSDSNPTYPVLVKPDTDYGVGPGLSFAQRWCQLNPTGAAGLIPCAKGETSIAQWQCTDANDTNTLFGASVARIKATINTGPFRGVLFYQGEADTKTEADAYNWRTLFERFVSDLRIALGKPSLPIVFAQLANPEFQRRPRPYWRDVQDEQARVSLSRVSMVTTADLPLNEDGLHLSTAAQITLGRRLANAMMAI